MKTYNIIQTIIIASIIVLLNSCTYDKNEITHLGKNISNSQNVQIEIDSIVIDAFYTSSQGNFFMKDSIITFADNYYARMFEFNCKNGELISQHFGLGEGPDEMLRFLYAYPIENDTSVFVIDGNLSVTLFGETAHRLDKKGMLDFKWDDDPSRDYESPKAYNFMFMGDFGTYIYNKDSMYIVPVSPMIKVLGYDGNMGKDFYKKSHILGLVNKKTLEVEKVFGSFPEICNEIPTPHFDFFSYLIDGDKLYYNHPIDSLVYVYEYPDKLLYTFGYECKDINRSYTKSTSLEDEIYEDYKKVGIVTEIKKFPESELFIRTYIKDMGTQKFGMQIYNSSHDLLADVEMPTYFKLLGYHDSYFYGVTMMPRETDENTFYTFYKIKIRL